MLIGIIGAPNKGKSTLFSALTLNDVEIADYPFTTINPNKGVAYATAACPHIPLGVRCNPKNSPCKGGTRMIPFNVVDVAGLVEGAHLGKGMGNKFLNDLVAADSLILVIDSSGKTDSHGNPCSSCDPLDDLRMVRSELEEWIASIVDKHTKRVSKGSDAASELHEILSGMGVGIREVGDAFGYAGLSQNAREWTHENILKFSKRLIERSKPIFVCANKSDINSAPDNKKSIQKALDGNVMFCSAAIELALKRAESDGIISYTPGEKDFAMLKADVSDEQRRALSYMKKFISNEGTNVQDMINKIVFGVLEYIVVYPVEDENRYTDHYGNVLPDSVLVRNGSTVYDLAAHIHTDLAKGLLYAVDARTKRRVGKDYILKDGDVIRVVSSLRS